jgi:diadenosine tetraphosphate (Ap4A) HIT family hydrolase
VPAHKLPDRLGAAVCATVVIRSHTVVCPFCARVDGAEPLAENALAVAFFDPYPVSPGHSLIVPRRHEPDFLSLTVDEQAAVWTLVSTVRRHVEAIRTPDGYNVGINVGEAAGQTIFHAHLHVIPRYHGDVADPRGGVRWIIPAKAPYWERP